MPQQLVPPSRRLNSPVEAKNSMWVYWECNGDRDVSRVKDMGVGGLFIETPRIKRVGAATNLLFLVRGANSSQRRSAAFEARRRTGIEVQSGK